MRGYATTGTSAVRSAYVAALGQSVWRPSGTGCEWIGINETRSASGIGLLGDGNGGCWSGGGSIPYADDSAFGIGLQSCSDANGCERGGSGHAACHSLGVDGVASSPNQGPWFVFGR